MSAVEKLTLVIPAFNEAKRLPPTLATLQSYLGTQKPSVEIEKIFIVDDGSQDDTANVIDEWAQKWAVVEKISFQENCGKGKAVRAGLEKSSTAATSPFILIADADGATGWEMLGQGLELLEKTENVFILMGSRAHSDSVILPRQSWLRESMGKTFNFILRQLTGLKYKDTQCGFKFIANDDRLQKLLPQLQVDRFSWDAELILLAQKENYPVLEMPVKWAHRVSSHVHVLFDSVEMLYNLFKMARRINKK